MTRGRFDPERMKGPRGGLFAGPGGNPSPGAPDEGERALRVSELASIIDRALREGTPRRVRVVGEVSGFTDRTHWYFSLKDEDAVVSCVMFASAARRVGFAVESGQEVVAQGRVEFYARQGRTQLYVERLEPVGAGALEQRFRALCAALKERGWFDPEAKQALPAFPRRVAVVTSKTGAALQDVLDTLRKRAPWVVVSVVDVRVQGEAAAPEVARAIGWLSRRHAELGLDAIILTRGGGSMEDLWAFNEEAVARAVWGCRVPIVAAIGHETDTTIAELVADERAATPTQAAMRLSPDRSSLDEQLGQLRRRLERAGLRRGREERDRLATLGRELRRSGRSAVVDRRGRVDRLALAVERARPAREASRRRARLSSASARLEAAMRGRVRRDRLEHAGAALVRAGRSIGEDRAARLDALERELWVVGPAHVLARGFTVTRGADGRAVRSVADVAAGESIETVVADGRFASVVGERTGAGGVPGDDRPAPSRRPRRRGADPGQMRLFGGAPAPENR
jgi:exodeoxyribonuclease VII large subunit